MLLKARCGWWIILRKQRSTNMPWWQRNSASDVSIITTWQLCCRLWFPYLCCCLFDWGPGAIHLRVLWLSLCPLTLCWWFWLTENNQGWLFFSCSSFFSLASSLCVREAKITKKNLWCALHVFNHVYTVTLHNMKGCKAAFLNSSEASTGLLQLARGSFHL